MVHELLLRNRSFFAMFMKVGEEFQDPPTDPAPHQSLIGSVKTHNASFACKNPFFFTFPLIIFEQSTVCLHQYFDTSVSHKSAP